MSYFGSTEFMLEVEKGNIPGHSVVKKFGLNHAVPTSFKPISDGGIYRTPQVSGATTLRVKSGGNAGDTVASTTGARKIIVQGLSSTGTLQQEEIDLAGASASSPTSIQFIRMFRAWVSESGVYADQDTPSHLGDIVIEDGAGTEDWGTIASDGFSRSQTNIAVYSVPLAFTAYLFAPVIVVDAVKSVEITLFKRENILETAAPYTAMRLVREYDGVAGELAVPGSAFMQFPALADFGWLGQTATGTAAVSIHFDILLVAD